METIKPDAVILLLSYNGMDIEYEHKPLLPQCLDKLMTTNGNFRIICITTGSTDGSEHFVREHYKGVEVMHEKENDEHIARIYNKGVKHALEKYKPKYIVIMSNDIFVRDASWLQAMMATSEEYKSAGIVGCKLLYPDGRIQFGGIKRGAWMHNNGKGKVDNGDYDYVEKVDAVHLACMLIKAEMFEKVGLFDENLRLGFEDTDYCMRVSENGFDVIYNGKISMQHLEGVTVNKTATDRFDSSRDIERFKKEQELFIYFTRKHYKGIKRYAGLAWVAIGRSVFTTSKLGVIGKANFRFNDKIAERLRISMNAINDRRDISEKL
jgi:GT2 family glycosyltransferase